MSARQASFSDLVKRDLYHGALPGQPKALTPHTVSSRPERDGVIG